MTTKLCCGVIFDRDDLPEFLPLCTFLFTEIRDFFSGLINLRFQEIKIREILSSTFILKIP